MYPWILLATVVALLLTASPMTFAAPPASGPAELPAFRPPAVPLVTHDPYFSVWSFDDRLTDGWPRHWTGENNALCGFVRIDNQTYRFCGPLPGDLPALEQVRLDVLPTHTIYVFRGAGIELTVTFLSPLLPDDLDLLSRPITYLKCSARATDGHEHAVKLYVDCSAEWAVNTPSQPVRWNRARAAGLHLLSFGSAEQPVLKKAGDNLRIDWGYFYLALPATPATDAVISGHTTARQQFIATGALPDSDDLDQPRPARDNWPVLAAALDLGSVGTTAATGTYYLGYDDLYSLEYFQRPVRPYWRRAGIGYADVLQAAVRDQADIERRCRAFDEELMTDLRAAGGEKYARLAALAYRQAMAAHKLVADFDGTPLMFPKENFSNGCIGTVDVFFPSAPYFLLFNPRLLEAQLRPIMVYAASARWRFPFAPHDLGTWPHANGQVYGGGERTEENQMPVEECGNMLVLLGVLAETSGNADFAAAWWPTVTKWAEYLRDKGLDPENQLCTDDFAGHLAHNANLSIKAILGLGAYARLCEMTGRSNESRTYRRLAERFVGEWQKLADDGDHYRLAFDKSGTWSQKYNLFWDRILREPLFPPAVAQRELAFYRTKLNRYGLPLDVRETYTKLDFATWTAAMTDNRANFEAIMNPMYDFAHQTPDRLPLTDWYQTISGKCQGFRARSVVGGIYAPLLRDRAVWQKWTQRATSR
jgi:hypothetical protein